MRVEEADAYVFSPIEQREANAVFRQHIRRRWQRQRQQDAEKEEEVHAMPMTSEPARRVRIVWHDRDRHDLGCRCGLCNRNGVSFGKAIVPAEARPELDIVDPLEVAYGPSEEAALHNARQLCAASGWLIVDPPGEGEDKP